MAILGTSERPARVVVVLLFGVPVNERTIREARQQAAVLDQVDQVRPSDRGYVQAVAVGELPQQLAQLSRARRPRRRRAARKGSHLGTSALRAGNRTRVPGTNRS